MSSPPILSTSISRYERRRSDAGLIHADSELAVHCGLITVENSDMDLEHAAGQRACLTCKHTICCQLRLGIQAVIKMQVTKILSFHFQWMNTGGERGEGLCGAVTYHTAFRNVVVNMHKLVQYRKDTLRTVTSKRMHLPKTTSLEIFGNILHC